MSELQDDRGIKTVTSLDYRSLADRFRRDGYIASIKAISKNKAAQCRRRLEEYEREEGVSLSQDFRGKQFLRLKCLFELVSTNSVLDAVEAIIGPNIMVFEASLFCKDPGDGSALVPWHQDGYYYQNENHYDLVTAWIALTDSNKSNGAMRVIPGSHKRRLEHQPVQGQPSSLKVLDRATGKIDEVRAVPICLAAGQMSLHHSEILHASGSNLSNRRRVGLAARFITPGCEILGVGRGVLMLRGIDYANLHMHLPYPTQDNDPTILAILADEQTRERELLSHLSFPSPS